MPGREWHWCDDHGRWGGHPSDHCNGVSSERNGASSTAHGGVGSIAHIAVLYTTPMSPPLLTVDYKTPRMPRFARKLTPDAGALHETFGHVSIGVLRATCREYDTSAQRPLPRCTLCEASNTQRAPTYHTPHSAATYPSLRSWQADLFGPVSTRIFLFNRSLT